MRGDRRSLRTLAVVNAVVLAIGIVGVVNHDDGHEVGGALAHLDQSAATTSPPSDPTDPPASPTPTDPPPVEFSPTDLADAATVTAAEPAAFKMTMAFRHQSWVEKGVPGRTTLHGVVEGDRLRYEMPGDGFLGANSSGLYGVRPARAVERAWLAARMGESSLKVTIVGRDLYECGRLPGGDRCEVFHDLPALVDTYWPSDLPLAFGVLAAIPRSHLLVLGGAVEVEPAAPAEVQGVPVRHVRGTFTIAEALRAQAGNELRDLQIWFGSLVPGLRSSELVADEPFPFEAWIDHDGMVRRLSTTMLASVNRFRASDAASAMEFMQTDPIAATVTVTVELSDFGGPFDITPPQGAEPNEWRSTGTGDPSVTAPIDVDEAEEIFEEMLEDS